MRSAPALVLLLSIAGIGLSAAVCFVVVPPVITLAYRGESLPVLNAMIRGQAVHSMDHYLQLWRGVSLQILVFQAILGLGVAAFSARIVQQGVDRLLGLGPGIGAVVRMSGRQRVIATAVVGTLVGGQGLNIVMQREDWPFSNYPMYAGQHRDRAAWIRVYGLTPTGEVVLVPERQLRPFDAVRLNYSFAGLVLERPDQVAAGRLALKSLHALYEAGRRSGEHHGPALESLRLYREIWLIEPGLANRTSPNDRQLLYELRLAD